MKSILLALSFLTVLPVGGGGEVSEKELLASTYAYPLVGFILGGLLCAVYAVARLLWPPVVACGLLVCAWIFLTAGLHLDGLMDTFDGLGVRGDRERRLAVMKDSRMGAHGVQAGVLLVLLKVLALWSLAGSGMMLPALLVAPTAGRAAMVVLMSAGRYARPKGGLGGLFVNGTGLSHALAALLQLVPLCFIALQWAALPLLAVLVVLTLGMHVYFASAFGGVTGDLLGAACELQELAAFLVLAALA